MTSILTTILSTLLLGKFTLGALSDSVPRSQWGQGSPSALVASCLFSLQDSAWANSTPYAPTPHHARLRMLPHHQQLFLKSAKTETLDKWHWATIVEPSPVGRNSVERKVKLCLPNF